MSDREDLIKRLTEEVLNRLAKRDARAQEIGQSFPVGDLIGAGADRVGIHQGESCVKPPVASYIDHTLLKPDATRQQIESLCAEAMQYRFKSVCVNSSWVSLCAQQLAGSGVATCTVIGFPLGATSTDTKTFEARRAQDDGARELDMVINVGRLKSGELEYVQDDIAAVCGTTRPGNLVKVILETCLLTDDEKALACRLARAAGADFVKTSTGFSQGGATPEDVALMRQCVGSALGVKASGGVKNFNDFITMVKAGATRIGASAGIRIVSES